ncbi:hypothetical protein GCM10010359_22630 [Streptomyces morookaense]|nr:hypothetical protein GCM10010359_22630 [Streptomyces morookaense]
MNKSKASSAKAGAVFEFFRRETVHAVEQQVRRIRGKFFPLRHVGNSVPGCSARSQRYIGELLADELCCLPGSGERAVMDHRQGRVRRGRSASSTRSTSSTVL